VRGRWQGAMRQKVIVDLLQGCGEHRQGAGLQAAEEQLTYPGDVPGSGSGDGLAACRCQDRIGGPAIVFAGQPVDQSPFAHPQQVVGEAASLPADGRRQVAQLQPASAGVRQGHQHVVVGEREARVVLQLPVHLVLQAKHHSHPCLPGALLLVGQPGIVWALPPGFA